MCVGVVGHGNEDEDDAGDGVIEANLRKLLPAATITVA